MESDGQQQTGLRLQKACARACILCAAAQIKYVGFSGLPLDCFTYILDR